MAHRPHQPSEAEVSAALEATGYRYSDPVEDDNYPRITAHDPDSDPEHLFPAGWGSEPTERDQAAIDAGNG